jgi:hypothetical protein
MKRMTHLLAVVLTTLFFFTACDREGPAERTGERTDQTSEEAEDAMQNSPNGAQENPDAPNQPQDTPPGN